MSVFSGCRKLVLSVFKRSVLLERGGVCRNVFREQSHSLCLTRRFPPSSASRQQRPHVFTCQPNTRRCSSEANSKNSDSEKEAEVSLEDSHESHGDSRAPGPSDTFTLDVLVSLLRQENAADICVIKVPDQIKYAEYFIVVSGTSQRHLRAMALYAIKVYKFLKKDGDPNVKTEGKDAEDWMCIDFGNMVVHFMLPEARELYELEKLWTLRSYDEQLRKMPVEKLPEDFIYDVDVTK